MPKSVKALAGEIEDEMKKGGFKVLGMPWPDFYKLAQMERFRDQRSKDFISECGARGIVVGYGKNVVTFCHDVKMSG